MEPTWRTKCGGRFRAYGKFASWSRIIRRISSGRMPSRGSRGKRSSQVVSKTVANYGAYSHLNQSLSHKVVWWDKSALSRLALTDGRYKRSFRVVPGVRATSMRRPAVSSRFFGRAISRADCRPTGGTSNLQSFLLRKGFSSAIDTADGRPTGGAQCCHPEYSNRRLALLPSVLFLWSDCSGASWVYSI